MGDGVRRYTETEFALILRRAAELQDRTDVPAGTGEGLTLPEISAIAREVGLEPAVISRAAAELDSGRPGRLEVVLGGAARHRLESALPGSLTPDGYAGAVDAIRAATGLHGTAREGVGTLEWDAQDGVTHLYVTLTPGAGATHVVLTADRSSGQAAMWLLSLLTSLFAVGITGAIVEPSTVVGGLGLGIGIVGAGALTARTLWASATRRFRERMEAVLDRIVSQVGTAAGSDSPQRPPS